MTGIRTALDRLATLLVGAAPSSEPGTPFDVVGWRLAEQPSLVQDLAGRTRALELVVSPLTDDGQLGATAFRRAMVEVQARYDAQGPAREGGAIAAMVLEDMDTIVNALRQPGDWQGATSGISAVHVIREARAVTPITLETREQPTALVVSVPFDLIYREGT